MGVFINDGKEFINAFVGVDIVKTGNPKIVFKALERDKAQCIIGELLHMAGHKGDANLTIHHEHHIKQRTGLIDRIWLEAFF